MNALPIVLVQAFTVLPPDVEMALITCTILLILFLLLILVFSPEGARRLANLIKEVQQIGRRERRYDQHCSRKAQRGQK